MTLAENELQKTEDLVQMLYDSKTVCWTNCFPHVLCLKYSLHLHISYRMCPTSAWTKTFLTHCSYVKINLSKRSGPNMLFTQIMIRVFVCCALRQVKWHFLLLWKSCTHSHVLLLCRNMNSWQHSWMGAKLTWIRKWMTLPRLQPRRTLWWEQRIMQRTLQRQQRNLRSKTFLHTLKTVDLIWTWNVINGFKLNNVRCIWLWKISVLVHSLLSCVSFALFCFFLGINFVPLLSCIPVRWRAQVEVLRCVMPRTLLTLTRTSQMQLMLLRLQPKRPKVLPTTPWM